MNWKTLLLSMVLIILFLGSAGCAGSAECGVRLDGDFPFPVVNPPGETGAGIPNCTCSKNMSIGEKTETTFECDCEFDFEESGNVYDVDLYVVIIDGKISEYQVEVTGGVYGQDAHICTSD